MIQAQNLCSAVWPKNFWSAEISWVELTKRGLCKDAALKVITYVFLFGISLKFDQGQKAIIRAQSGGMAKWKYPFQQPS